MGRTLTALLSPNLSNYKLSILRRWNLCQRHTADIWEKWSWDYIQQLQRYSKWAHPQRTIRVTAIVLLKDTELFVRSWPLARVIEVHPGKDGQVRVATLRTEKGDFKCAVNCPLIEEEDQASSAGQEDVQASEAFPHGI